MGWVKQILWSSRGKSNLSLNTTLYLFIWCRKETAFEMENLIDQKLFSDNLRTFPFLPSLCGKEVSREDNKTEILMIYILHYVNDGKKVSLSFLFATLDNLNLKFEKSFESAYTFTVHSGSNSWDEWAFLRALKTEANRNYSRRWHRIAKDFCKGHHYVSLCVWVSVWDKVWWCNRI